MTEKQVEGDETRGKKETLQKTEDRQAGKRRFSKDLPGSAGISEPFLATHLQPLTRCH